MRGGKHRKFLLQISGRLQSWNNFENDRYLPKLWRDNTVDVFWLTVYAAPIQQVCNVKRESDILFVIKT